MFAAAGTATSVGATAVGSLVVDAATGGLNIAATPAELALGGVLGGGIGYGLGSALDWLIDAAKNPWTGNPGEERQCNGPDGKPKQTRRYGNDGYPVTDTDWDHDHGQGQPHVHDWGRPPGGGPPTAADRGPGRPPESGDPGIP
jgi:hypothetical protein